MTAPQALGVSVLFNFAAADVCRTLALVAAVMYLAPVSAQERIFRCGNEYINDATQAKARGCKLMEGGNITIVQGTSPQQAAAPKTASSAPAKTAPRSDSTEQRARDSDARQILETELRKAEQRLGQAQKAYAGGQPEKEGIESRNHQRYLDRVAELKESVSRAESDVSGLRRELGRMGGAPQPSASAPNGENTAK